MRTSRSLPGLIMLLGAPALAQGTQPPTPQHAFEVELAKVKWTNFGPKDSNVRYSILQVDSVSGATQMFWQLPPNATSPCHWHAASESNVVVQGSITMRHGPSAAPVSLGVGGFGYVPRRKPHQLTTGPSTTIVFSSLDGPFDFHAVDQAQCDAAQH